MTWDKKKLDKLPHSQNLIRSGDDRIERYREDAMMRGNPDAVIIPQNENEVADILSYCHGNEIPVTFCGSQTSETGASVPLEGLIVSTEKFAGIADIFERDGEHFANVRPGTIIADLQSTLAEKGFFYPVAPTSRDSCRIGANIATNASGEDSYQYGPVRPYVMGLELIMADGSKRVLERETSEKPSRERNRAGYFMGWKNPIDLIIGSEGTLAFVSGITLKILPASPEFFSALIPFSSTWQAIGFAMQIILGKSRLKARAMELIDTGALNFMKTAQGFPPLSDAVQAFLYIKQEYKDEKEKETCLLAWYEEASKGDGASLMESLFIAETPKQADEFRLWRHRVPEVTCEMGRNFWADGGAKIGSDWWVPVDRLPEMMKYFYDLAEKTGMISMGYAHIGVGNPHTNFIAKNAQEKKLALAILEKCCRKAVELGGGVAGEHGIGKLHADQLIIQHPAATIEQMKQWKREYDPHGILGKGNIFGE